MASELSLMPLPEPGSLTWWKAAELHRVETQARLECANALPSWSQRQAHRQAWVDWEKTFKPGLWVPHRSLDAFAQATQTLRETHWTPQRTNHPLAGESEWLDPLAIALVRYHHTNPGAQMPDLLTLAARHPPGVAVVRWRPHQDVEYRLGLPALAAIAITTTNHNLREQIPHWLQSMETIAPGWWAHGPQPIDTLLSMPPPNVRSVVVAQDVLMALVRQTDAAASPQALQHAETNAHAGICAALPALRHRLAEEKAQRIRRSWPDSSRARSPRL